jgi:diguanylate cyclase (GGDEF)-like protein/putative nucleotidyltransferase with HDIG domain
MGLGILRRPLAAVAHALPRGGTLPAADWNRRHLALVASIWVCTLVLLAYGAANRLPVWHNAAHIASIMPLAVIAAMPRFDRPLRTAAASLALLTVCALLIHMSGGLIEMHFSFFVVIVVLTLYEDWVPFLIAIVYVLVHHGVVGTLDPHAVFNRPDAWNHPWKWAGIHALFVSLAGVAGVVAWRLNEDVRVRMHEAQRKLELMSLTDSLTGLSNRRRLLADLEQIFAGGGETQLMLFDLNGFKDYNDSYGHLAGDALLQRIGQRLRTAVEPAGRAYRLGGDEFCVIADVPAELREGFQQSATCALTEVGDAFTVTSSVGAVLIPGEAPTPEEALRLADQRMYLDKSGSRASAGSQSRDVLLQVLTERVPELGEHSDDVAELAVAVAQRLGLHADEVQQVQHAAQLHDIGKIAIPDEIIDKPAALDETEWAFMRQHTVIGQRIIAAAPALGEVGRIVRSSHERWDGHGYPDGLAGDAIPLGARIVAVCDAYDAMVTDRPYRKALPVRHALAEIGRCSGGQFDPRLVEVFARVIAELQLSAAAAGA